MLSAKEAAQAMLNVCGFGEEMEWDYFKGHQDLDISSFARANLKPLRITGTIPTTFEVTLAQELGWDTATNEEKTIARFSVSLPPLDLLGLLEGNHRKPFVRFLGDTESTIAEVRFPTIALQAEEGPYLETRLSSILDNQGGVDMCDFRYHSHFFG